jgi:hypothetical protein
MQSQCPGKVDALVIHDPLDEQVGYNAASKQGWTDGRGALALQFFYANDGCTAPAFDPNDTTVGRVDFTCAPGPDGVHPWRVSRWIHNYMVTWQASDPHHWFPPETPGEVWKFIAATP